MHGISDAKDILQMNLLKVNYCFKIMLYTFFFTFKKHLTFKPGDGSFFHSKYKLTFLLTCLTCGVPVRVDVKQIANK